MQERSRSAYRSSKHPRGLQNDSGMRLVSSSSSDSISNISFDRDKTLASKYHIKKNARPPTHSSYNKRSEPRRHEEYRESHSAYLGEGRSLLDNEVSHCHARKCAGPCRSRSISNNAKKRKVTPNYMKTTNTCSKENVMLKKRLTDNERSLEKGSKKIRKLKKSLLRYQEEYNALTERLKSEEEDREAKVDHLKQRMSIMQDNEMRLIQELKEQQLLAKDAFVKLQDVQEAEMKEKERLRVQYEQFYNQKFVDEMERYEMKLKSLEAINEELLDKVKALEAEKAVNEAHRNVEFNSELVILRRELQTRTIECENHRDELNELKALLREQKSESSIEIANMRREMKRLIAENETIRSADIAASGREVLRERLRELEDELQDKQYLLVEKDRVYKSELDTISDKVIALQRELKKMQDYELKIDELTRQLELRENEFGLMEKHYKEKLMQNKLRMKTQKKDWTKIYDELLEEIRNLKKELDFLGFENKKLLTSFNSANEPSLEIRSGKNYKAFKDFR